MATQTGGAYINEGKYGCIFIPPLLCEGQKQVAVSSETVSKIGDAISIKNEVEIAKVLQSIPLSRNYFVYAIPHSYCKPAPLSQQTDRDISKCNVLQEGSLKYFRMIQMPYGGIGYRRTSINLWNFGKHLLEGLSLLLISGIVHFDLHSGNILVDKFRVPRIIDWGYANLGPNATLTDFGQVTDAYFSVKYSQQPPEIPLFVQAYNRRSIDDAVTQLFVGRRDIHNIIHTFLGIDKDLLFKELNTFRVQTQFLEKKLDFPTWWKSHWATYDSWSLGVILVKIAYEQQRMTQLFNKPEYAIKAEKIKEALRGMLNFNCFERFNAIEALAVWDSPNNPIIQRFGKIWLTKKDN